jgi:RIMS-binding protein 2
MNTTVGVETILQDIQKSTEKQQNLKSQQSEFLSELNKLSDKAKLNGSSINAYQSDIESFQSKLREVEQKINLENAQYEELMLELQLNKTKHGQSNGTGNGYPPGMDGHGHGGLGGLDRITAHTSASHLGLNGYNGHGAHVGAASTSAAAVTTMSSGHRPPLGQITQASLEGYMTDTSSVLGGHQPLITISQPNGKKDEYNNNEKEALPQDILRLLKASGHGDYGGRGLHGLAGEHDSASQISRSLPRQDTSDTEHTVDLNIFNDEMRLRNNIENMYKKDPVMYSGGETSGLESSFTSPSVHHKDFIEQYLNKLSYLPGDVITNSEPLGLGGDLGGIGSRSGPGGHGAPFNTTSYTSPFLTGAVTTTAAPGGGISGINDLLAETTMYNSFSSGDIMLDGLAGSGGVVGGGMAAGGVVTGSGGNVVDMLEIPGKGRCHIYFSRYSYDPFNQSLNDNPESELSLNAGEYILVWGDTDEDGYLEGELLDGRKGLVPMNFCERLTGEDLLEFHQQIVLGFTSEEEVWSTMVPNDLPMDLGGTGIGQPTMGPAGGFVTGNGGLDSSGLMATPIDEPAMSTNPYIMDDHLLNATYYSPELEEPLESTAMLGNIVHSDSPNHVETAASVVPAPRQLTLERQLNKSILIGWTSPDCPPGQIEMYHVYVDGFLRTTVRSTDKTKALVEGVDNARPHRISVRSVTVNRKTSKDAACTMIIGKDAPLGPSCVRASNVTSTSSVISWLPSNSNFQHTVCINNVEVRTVKPGTYKHTITGLTPNTVYRVTVRAKNIKASPFVDEKSLVRLLEKLSAHTEFRTLNKALPDPPMDVRVDGGPQDGTILVTWIPVTLNTTGVRHVPVTGYAVFADGKRVTDVDSPSSDHALVDLGCIGHFNPKLITVRSKSGDLLSNDSSAVPIQASSRTRRAARGDSRVRYGPTSGYGGGGAGGGRGGRSISKPRNLRGFRDASGQLVFDPDDENLSDKELYARNIPAIGSELEAYSDEDYSGEGRRGRHGGAWDRRNKRRGGRQDGSRIFVALFDYDPPTMSPNPEACDEELPFREGQLIKIYGDKDADGFYWGECGKRSGYVPCNMVSEVQVEDERMVQEFLKEERGGRGPGGGLGGRGGPGGGVGGPGGPPYGGSRDRWGDIYANTPVKKMIALYDYDPHELSPNVDLEVELPFRTGDVIYVYGDMDDDGFFLAELRGQRGLVPSNFLSEVPNQGGRPGGPGAVGAAVQRPGGPAGKKG